MLSLPTGRQGLILSGAFYPDLKIGVWRHRMYQREFPQSYQFNLIKIQFWLRLFLYLLYSLPFLCYETMQNHIDI
jgi:hypothetical protein